MGTESAEAPVVLVADDTPSIRLLIEHHLSRAGYGADLVEDGRAAVDLFRSKPYRLVILDIQMPALDGRQAVRQMRSWERENGKSPVPILALTANASEVEALRLRESGFTATLSKPFSRADLTNVVSGLLGSPPPAPVDAAAIVVEVDPEFADLVPQFLDHCRSNAALMKDALSRRDYAAVAAWGHVLMGSGTSYGFPPISDAGRALESAAKDEDAGRAARQLDSLCLYLEQVRIRHD